MNLNYSKLSKMQAELDEYIGKSKGINMADYKLERIIALQVEFNELLNEVPFLFKYWSSKKMDREKALEEYCDCLHFLLSIGNDIGIKGYEYQRKEHDLKTVIDMRILVLGINNMISRTYAGDAENEYKELLDHFLLFGEKLGFHKNEIITHYELKHAENYSRQANGY